MQFLVILTVFQSVLTSHRVGSTVVMREEECQYGTLSSSGRRCGRRALVHRRETIIPYSNLRSSVLGVDLPKMALRNSSVSPNRYTPLPYAAFMQPRPVYQSSEQRVFNVLHKERTSHRLLKGGKRQEDQVKDNSTLDGKENNSRSGVQFRRRKGGVRSDKRKQLRRERIERKRARRKNRRKNRRERKKQGKHSNQRKGRKRIVNRSKLKSLDSRRRRRKEMNRSEQIGINPTVFIEDPEPAELKIPELNGAGRRSSLVPLEAIDTEVILEDAINSLPKSSTIDQNPNIDVHNYQQNNLDDYEEDETFTDLDYSAQDSDGYHISADYFNWKDNSSFDYFTQGEDTTVSSDPKEGPGQLDPSRHRPVRQHLVRLHNLLRSRVEPPAANMLALSWHATAATQAHQWAGACVTHRGRDHPSVRWTPRYGACGQNVLVTRRKRRWGHVIRNWWNERRFFQYGATDARNATYRARSYTQLAWYSSHKLGCGYSECSTVSGRTFHRYVCNYCPAGNDPSRLSLPYTRGRPCEMCPNACRSVCPGGQCRLCTNRCAFSDLWANCATLAQRWKEWLCNTKTISGVDRFKNCRATCQCAIAGDKII